MDFVCSTTLARHRAFLAFQAYTGLTVLLNSIKYLRRRFAALYHINAVRRGLVPTDLFVVVLEIIVDVVPLGGAIVFIVGACPPFDIVTGIQSLLSQWSAVFVTRARSTTGVWDAHQQAQHMTPLYHGIDPHTEHRYVITRRSQSGKCCTILNNGQTELI